MESKGRNPAGISVFARTNIAKKITVVGGGKSTVWIRVIIDRAFVIGFGYRHPVGSKYEEKRFFENVSKELGHIRG